MDYSSETCMNMFTKGQVELMRNVLTGPRSGLLENTNTIAPTAQHLSWKISPNPSDGLFSLDVESESSQDLALRIFNVEGKTMLQQAQRALFQGKQRLSFDGTSWPAGMYFLELKTPGGSSVKKLVKR